VNITRPMLENEILGLRQQLAQAQGQVDSVNGAIQAVEQLIYVLDKPESEEEHEGKIPA
jgi:hypothetical protein